MNPVSWDQKLDALSIQTLRRLSLDQVQQAQSGHVGFPLGAAPILHCLYSRHLRYDPTDPQWPDRDRFVLSAGHGSALLYAMLHISGYELTLDDLRDFRQWGSKTPGHPESDLTPGVEATTGPLGQGFANAVGMAIAQTMVESRLPVGHSGASTHRTFALVSDGDLMEGITLEAAALAGLLKLGKLVVLYDDNNIVIDGPADVTHNAAATCAAFEQWGWQILEVPDGEDVAELDRAIAQATAETAKPSLIRVTTVIGFGSRLAGTSAIHSGALNEQEEALVRDNLGLDSHDRFVVPAEVSDAWGLHKGKGQAHRIRWSKAMESLASSSPEIADLIHGKTAHARHDDEAFLLAQEMSTEPEAARISSGKIIDVAAELNQALVGGVADLAAATMAYISQGGDYSPENRAGRNIRFGVREHAMAAIANGISLQGSFRPFSSTFLVFATYQMNAIRMAALQHLPVIHVFSHDSITVGEDGPTHQPIEVLAGLRSIPNLLVLRPGDARETAECWSIALGRHSGPSALILSRAPLAQQPREIALGDSFRGGYVISGPFGGAQSQITLVASGSELHVAVEAQRLLDEQGIHSTVVSMPSQQLFFEQPQTYQDSVLDPQTPRIIIEASHPMSLWQLAGPHGQIHGIESFGASAPPAVMLEKFRMTAEQVSLRAVSMVEE